MKCPECGSETEDTEGPTHAYMLSSPGCWRTYGEILEKEYSNPAYMKIHRLTVDAFACQHVGTDDPRAKQSVIVHLAALYLAIECKTEFSKIPPIMDAIVKQLKGKFPKLPRPDFTGTMNVTDVIAAKSAEEHCKVVSEWANQVWSAWKNEHGRIRDIVSSFVR